MLNIGDYGQHQIAGLVGQVVGYGHEVLHGGYLTTLKVRETHKGSRCRSRFTLDVHSASMPAKMNYSPVSEGEVALQA